MTLALVLIAVIYVLLILFLVFGFSKVKKFSGSGNASVSFSVVIAFRNETENLPQLFSSLEKLKYPTNLYEIILVDDASDDNSHALCESFRRKNEQLNISILKNQQPKLAKKGAIATGIKSSVHDYIATTDADCELPPLWLLEFDDFILETDSDLIAGPVMYKERKGALNIFQNIDFLSLQGATIGGFGVDKPFMCNGANLCYKKESYLNLHGFSGNEKIASGDDIFLLEKMQNAKQKTGFLRSRNSIVETLPQQNFSNLVNQRVRWAAKASAYKSGFGKFVGWTVFLMNLALIIGFFSWIFKLIPQRTFLILFLFKFNADFILIYRTAIFFKTEKIMKNYFWCSFIYPFFTCYIAIKALFSWYTWKGRQFKM